MLVKNELASVLLIGLVLPDACFLVDLTLLLTELDIARIAPIMSKTPLGSALTRES